MRDLNQWVGRSQSVSDVVTQSGVDRFCATIGCEQVSQDSINVAPLGYHWCLGLPDSPMSGLGEDGHPKKGGFLPPVELPRRMWASSNVEFIQALPVGSTITRQSSIASVAEKSGKSGVLVFVGVEHETQVDGEVAIREQQTIVYREASQTAAALPVDKVEQPTDWQVVERLTPSPQLLFRYSALTFNSHRIHYDLPYAQTQELYPGLIVHGPLMATLVLQLAAKHGDVAKFSFRGMSPAYCDQSLFLTANFDKCIDTPTGELATIGGDGRTCLSAQVEFNK
jgi:3-methylfumaryl-CoA hydratase